VIASRRLGALLCAALLGVLFAGGLVLSAVAELPVVVGYGSGVVALIWCLAVRHRMRLGPPPLTPPPDRTCTCCTASQHDPARVI
jgi:hypothetical protein